MVLATQLAVCGVGWQDGYTGLLIHAGPGLQQLGVGVQLAVGQQEDALARGHSVTAGRQALLCQIIIKVLLHLTLKVILIPFLFAVGQGDNTVDLFCLLSLLALPSFSMG